MNQENECVRCGGFFSGDKEWAFNQQSAQHCATKNP